MSYVSFSPLKAGLLFDRNVVLPSLKELSLFQKYLSLNFSGIYAKIALIIKLRQTLVLPKTFIAEFQRHLRENTADSQYRLAYPVNATLQYAYTIGDKYDTNLIANVQRAWLKLERLHATSNILCLLPFLSCNQFTTNDLHDNSCQRQESQINHPATRSGRFSDCRSQLYI
jgi:hypothetical protein